MSTTWTDPAASPQLLARTVELSTVPDLFAALPDQDALAWVRRGEGLVAWGEVARIETSGPDRFSAAAAWWQELAAGAVVRDEVQLPGTGPVAFGSFGFADHSRANSVLIVPRVVLGRRGDTTWLTTVALGDQLPAPAAMEPLTAEDAITGPGQVTFKDGALTTAQWQAVVADAIARIQRGDLDKVVLARDVVADCETEVDVRWLLTRLSQHYPSCWTFAVDGMVGATPELLVRREKGLVASRVLAGTIQRTGDDEADLAHAAALARSSKDLEEHEYAVRSVADVLAPYCTSMNVPEAPFVLHLPNVMHLASDVTGVLATSPHAPGASSLELAAALHPSAAVCGTPRAAADDLIAEIEGMDRDRYAGPVGWIDAAGDGEWGIALRCARIDAANRRRVRLFAGCGIVAASDPAEELAESNAKLRPMQQALGGSQ